MAAAVVVTRPAAEAMVPVTVVAALQDSVAVAMALASPVASHRMARSKILRYDHLRSICLA